MHGDQRKNYLYIVKDVVIKHGSVIIQCDSAIRKMDEGIIEGFGHIYIYQPDTFTLSGGEYLRYTEESKTAFVSGKQVVLQDKQMTLVSTSLQYDTKNQLGYYTNGADITSESNHLNSKRGTYSRRANIFTFKEQVVLKSPDYTMYSDTLDYHAGSRTAYFFGPTRIVSKENTIVCNYGWYNTLKEQALFSKKAIIYSDSSFISADSLLYDRKKGEGIGIGGIRLFDSSERIDIYGAYGRFYRTGALSMITGEPLAIRSDNEDTMYLMADSFYFRNDSTIKYMKAYHRVSIYQEELQGYCDSMMYDFNDSTIYLYHEPVLWSDKSQISGDTMRILMKNRSISRLYVRGNSFIASEVKTNTYDQISGVKMDNVFESGKLKSVYVDGNASSIYYLRDNETDSAEYTGVNKVTCASMQIGMDTGKVKDIRFYGKPEGKIHPVNAFPDTEKFLPGMSWMSARKPVLESFLKRKEVRKPKPAESPVVPKKEEKKKKKTGTAKKSKS